MTKADYGYAIMKVTMKAMRVPVVKSFRQHHYSFSFLVKAGPIDNNKMDSTIPVWRRVRIPIP
jgi:hypothetical protein